MKISRSQLVYRSYLESLNSLGQRPLAFLVDEKIKHRYPLPLSNTILVMPGGESSKSFESLQYCCDFFLSRGITREHHFVVIGGGSLIDLGGLVASLLLRGLSWTVIPTTLLAMVDSSIGGKTGINTVQGKNQLGSFHPPEKIFLDEMFLSTLSQADYESGLGEILKYAFLNLETYQAIKQGCDLLEVMKTCVDYKLKLVERDLWESKERKFLNLGHTLGHGLESFFNISHGQAVKWGLFLVFWLEERLDLVKEFVEMTELLYGEFCLPDWLQQKFPVSQILNYIEKDKKGLDGHKIHLVGIHEIGRPYLKVWDFCDLKICLEKMANEKKYLDSAL